LPHFTAIAAYFDAIVHRSYHWGVIPLSRRRFARLAGTAAIAAPPLFAQPAPVTAQDVVHRIRNHAGVPWQPESLDTFKAGDPATRVTGIATTAMATMDVLTRALAAKANLVITLEPTFYGRLDPAGSPGDPVYTAKQEFLRKNNLVVWRFSDHWRIRKPEPFATGLAAALAWTKYQVGGDVLRYDLPPVTLSALARDIKQRLHARAGLRIVGDPQTRVRRIALLPGLSTLAAAIGSLSECDLLLAGETREWESVEYVQDVVASGEKKGMILLGRVLSEEPGMNVCAEWIRTLVPEFPVRSIPAGDPYWRPA
jgi:putative NIF3 family GTP cyclohydrolase 1 type 2